MLVKFVTTGLEHKLECAHKIVDTGGYPAPFVATVLLCEVQHGGNPVDHNALANVLADNCEIQLTRDNDDVIVGVNVKIDLGEGEHIYEEDPGTGRTIGHHRSGEDYPDEPARTPGNE